jgi:transcriptional regulator with XRE-family HTH domain
VERSNVIGEFLRARRALLRPEDVGLPDYGRRRVDGLRREEVAMLAGISTDYYLRLEQGRDTRPSVDVLDALGRALRLDEDAARHLQALSARRPTRAPARRTDDRVPTGITSLISTWDRTPAFVHSRHLDVLDANSLAVALFPCLRPGVNLVTVTFLDPSIPELFGDWEASTEAAVAWLRASSGADVDDPRLTELVGDLSVRSPRFAELWARHDARPKQSHGITIEHPDVGTLRLWLETLTVGSSGGDQTLLTYHAEPGSTSADRLARLAALRAG